MSKPVDAARENFAPAARAAFWKHRPEKRTPVADATTPRDTIGALAVFVDETWSTSMFDCTIDEAAPATVPVIVMVNLLALVYWTLICTDEIGLSVEGEKAEIKLDVEVSADVQVVSEQLNTEVLAVEKRTS